MLWEMERSEQQLELPKNVATVSARGKASVWKTPPELIAAQVMPWRSLHFLTLLYESFGPHEKCCFIPLGVRFLVKSIYLY